MNDDPSKKIRDLFMAALDYESIAARDAFLDEQCGDNSAMRRRLSELLRAHDAPDDVLDRSALEQLPPPP